MKGIENEKSNHKKKLKTTDNSFGPDCVQGLSEGLKVNTSLRELSIKKKKKRTN